MDGRSSVGVRLNRGGPGPAEPRRRHEMVCVAVPRQCWVRVRSRAASAIPALAEQDGQAFSRPASSVNTRAKRSETCDPQWSQRDICWTGIHRCRHHPIHRRRPNTLLQLPEAFRSVQLRPAFLRMLRNLRAFPTARAIISACVPGVASAPGSSRLAGGPWNAPGPVTPPACRGLFDPGEHAVQRTHAHAVLFTPTRLEIPDLGAPLAGFGKSY